MSRRSMFEKSNNPVMSEKKLHQVLDRDMIDRGEVMTIQGAINKTLILMGIMFIAAAFGFTVANPILMWVGMLGGAGVMFYASYDPSRSALLGPIFAALEGLLVGTITNMYWYAFDGIVFQAVTITFAILFTMLMIYKSGWIKVDSKFRAGVSMAVGAVMLLYLINIVLHFCGINMPFLHDGGALSIGITLVIIGIASLNLLLDFDNFEKGEQMKVPAYMEWYFGMGLLFTLIWLYLEILRLLSYLSSD